MLFNYGTRAPLPPAPSKGDGGSSLKGLWVEEVEVFLSGGCAPLPPARVHERTVSHRTVPVRMGRIDLQIVRWRRRAQAPVPARPTAVPCFRFSPDGDPRTGPQDQGPSGTLLPGAARWSHAPRSGLPPRSGAEKHTRGWLDHPIPPVQSRSSMVERPRTGAAARSFL